MESKSGTEKVAVTRWPDIRREERDCIREAFLNMIADATRFDEDVDGDIDSQGRTTMTIDYHLTVGHSQLEELCDALGIKAAAYGETVKDAIDTALAEPPAIRPQPSREGEK